MKNNIMFIFIIILTSCANNNKVSENTIVFSLGREVPNLTESFIDSISIIELKDNNNSMISYIKKAVVFNNKIFILDFNMKKPILVFDINGEFSNEIGMRGNSESEFIMISDFSIDDSYVYLYDEQKKSVLKYNYQGEYINTFNTDFRADAIQKTSTGFIFSIQKEDNKYKILITDNDLNILNKYFVFSSSDEDNKLTDNIFQKIGNDIYYNKPIDNHIYKFDDNGKYICEYYFDFGNKSVPQKIMEDYGKLSKEKEYNDYMFFYDAPFIVGDFIIGKIFNKNNKAVLIYNTKTREYFINELLKNEVDFKKIIFPLGVSDNNIIGYVDFTTYDNMINKPLLSEEQKKALNNGSILLSVYHLKNN